LAPRPLTCWERKDILRFWCNILTVMLRGRGVPDLAGEQAMPRSIACVDRTHTNRKSTADEWIVGVPYASDRTSGQHHVTPVVRVGLPAPTFKIAINVIAMSEIVRNGAVHVLQVQHRKGLRSRLSRLAGPKGVED